MFGTPQVVKRALQPNNVMLPGQLPVAGINARDALVAMAPTDAIDLINVLSNPYGLTVRPGYEEFATNLPGSTAVETLMSFYPATAPQSVTPPALQNSITDIFQPSPTADVAVDVGGELFACTNGQIYDITAGGIGPWAAQPGVTATSDIWTWINFQNAVGNFLLACNFDGGYYAYGEVGFSSGFSTGFRTKASGFAKIAEGTLPGTIQGINPDLFVYMMTWKRRNWFIEKDSSRAWYLPVEQVTGEAHQFDFGPHFRHGGRLEILTSWTVDGGEGIDDYLVAISSQGDVVIFKGYDPDSAATDPAAFQLHGIWYVGALPYGRRCADPVGGDIYILSVTGLSRISQLVAMGQIASELTEDSASKIDPLIRTTMQDSQNTPGWFIKLIPHEQMMLVGVPEVLIGEGPAHLALKIRQKAWSKLLDLPISYYLNHGGLVFGGGDALASTPTAVGKVFLMFDNALDFARIGDPLSGNLVRCRVTPAYSAFGSPGHFKRYTMVRPTFVTQGPVSVKINVMTDYGAGQYFNTPTLPAQFGDLWDNALWNRAKWSGFSKPIHKWLGVTGGGFAATCQIDFSASGGSKLMSIDWNVVPGGIL